MDCKTCIYNIDGECTNRHSDEYGNKAGKGCTGWRDGLDNKRIS